MFSALRTSTLRTSSTRAFSTSRVRASDLSKLVLTGWLTRDAEVRVTKNDREYVAYTIAVNNPSLPNGERAPATFHTIISFNDGSNKFLRGLKKGTRIYTEANFEIKDPVAGADPSTPQGQRQIFLRHESLRVLGRPKSTEQESSSESFI